MTGPKPTGPTHPTPTGPPKTQHVRTQTPARPGLAEAGSWKAGGPVSDRAGALTPRPGAVPGLSDPPDPKPIPNPHPYPPPIAS